MKAPSFQFYPGDWRRNANLRRCSPAARGFWLDVMCLMHDSDEYGVLRWTLPEIARAVGCDRKALSELVAKGVLKGAPAEAIVEPYVYTPRSGRKDGTPVTLIAAQPGPLWFSSRMVRDEYVRQHRGESSRFGALTDGAVFGAPNTSPTPAPKPPIGDGSSSAVASASADNKKGPAVAVPTPSELSPAASKAGRVGRGVNFTTFVANCKALQQKPIPADDPVFRYIKDLRIPEEYLRLAWSEFSRRYGDKPRKHYTDWRRVFLNCVRENWFGIWAPDEGSGWKLTSKGVQVKREANSRARQERPAPAARAGEDAHG